MTPAVLADTGRARLCSRPQASTLALFDKSTSITVCKSSSRQVRAPIARYTVPRYTPYSSRLAMTFGSNQLGTLPSRSTLRLNRDRLEISSGLWQVRAAIEPLAKLAEQLQTARLG